MMKFFEKIVDKVQDSVLDYVVKYLDEDMKPEFRAGVEEIVKNFRATLEDQVPKEVSRQLQDADDSRITGMIAQALSGKAEVLVETLLEYYRPEVDKSTESLTDTITNECMTRVKNFLGVGETPQAAPEPGTRGFNLPGVGHVDITQTVGSFIGINERMPTLEKDLHENFQPLAEKLRKLLYDKFIQVLNASLNEAFPWLKLPVARDISAPQVKDRGWLGDALEDIGDALKNKVVKHVPELYEALQEPVEEIIAKLVKWLEDHSVTTCVEKVRAAVKHLDLVKQQQ